MSFLARPAPPSALAIVALVAGLAAGCGDDPGRLDAQIIRVVSLDIDEAAVNLLRLTALPRGDSGFIADPELVGSGFVEGLSGRVEGDTGSFVLEATAGFVQDNAFLVDGANFAVDIPVFNVQEEPFRGMDPELIVEVIRNSVVIGGSDQADSEGFLPIPLEPSEDPEMPELIVRVACETRPDAMGDPRPLEECNPPM